MLAAAPSTMEQQQSVDKRGGLNPFDSDDDERDEDRGEGEGDPGAGGTREREDPAPLSQQQRSPLKIELHCAALKKIMSDTAQLTDPFLLEEFRGHLGSVEKLVSRERPSTRGEVGDNLALVLSDNTVESVYVFSTQQRAHSREIRVMLLRFFTEIFVHSAQDVLIHQQFLRPLNRLLRACDGAREGEVASALVPLLHQICILIQENLSLLDLFFVEAKAHHPARFFLLSQLVPYMHDVTEIGNRARDALLLCLSLADQLSHAGLSQFIAIESNFCQVLATGLSGLYSDLPTSVRYTVDEWQSPLPVIEGNVPGLTPFYQALDFCNSVLQISSKVICDRILGLVRHGFLRQVVGPALFQKSEESVTVAMAYLTLFLGHVTNMALMREFLRFLVAGKCDDRLVINVILHSVSSPNVNTCAVALELLYVLVDLNCEDVLLELVFKYLLTGGHVMHNQVAVVARPDIYGEAARKFLQLLPSSCITAEKMFLESIRPPSTQSQHSSYPGTPNRVGSPPPPPLLTSSPFHHSHPATGTTQLERPRALPHLAVPRVTNGVSSNPFDAPLPPTTPRSRSGSNGSSTGSLVSISSSASMGQPLANHSLTQTSSSSAADMVHFEYVPPQLSYMRNLLAAREAIATCWTRCWGWSSLYDHCSEQASRDAEEEKRRRADLGKSHEMEDITGKETVSRTEGEGEEEKSLAKLSSFRTRSATVSTSYRLPLARNRESGPGGSGTNLRPGSLKPRERDGVDGAEKSIQQALQAVRRRSPRLSRRTDESRFEDKSGLLLKVLMDKLSEMLSLPPAVNVQLTRVIGRLAHYPQPLLRSLLLNHQLVLRPGVPNLYYVLQGLKVTIDRHARSQEDFEKRLGRARKTMIYRAHVRNAQLEESVASQIVARLTRQSSTVSQPGDRTAGADQHKSPADSTEDPLPPTADVRTRQQAEVQRTRSLRRTRRTKPKKVSTDTLFSIVIFDEFLKELASLAHEHASLNLTALALRTTASL